MTLADRNVALLNEAKAMLFFFNVTSVDLSNCFKNFFELYSSTYPVSTEEFEESLNKIEDEIEDLCIKNKISQEKLEELMENNFAFKNVVIY